MSRSTGVTFDEMAVSLAHTQRRRLLVALLERDPSDGPLSETDPECADTPDERVALRHVHLPKLAEHGFVRWHEASGEVRRGPAFTEIEPLLQLLVEHEAELPGELA